MGGRVRLRFEVQGQGCGGIVEVDVQVGMGELKNWTIFMDVVYVSSLI